jgi:hypothetical protein
MESEFFSAPSKGGLEEFFKDEFLWVIRILEEVLKGHKLQGNKWLYSTKNCFIFKQKKKICFLWGGCTSFTEFHLNFGSKMIYSSLCNLNSKK